MKLRLLGLLTILLLALTACSNEDNTGGNGGGGSDVKLSERAGTYTCVGVTSNQLNQTITVTEAGLITVDTFSKQFDPTSTETSFIITSHNDKDIYRVEFDTKKLIGLNIGNDNNTYNFTKN